MKQKWLWLVLAVGLIVLIGAAAILYPILSKQTQTQAPETEESAQTIPYVDFTAVDLEGNEVSLSDYIGKPIVLNFWASWCPPCKSEMPDFDAVAKELDGEVVFLMVDMVDGMQETKDKGAQFIKEQGFSFPVLYDVNQEAASLGAAALALNGIGLWKGYEAIDRIHRLEQTFLPQEEVCRIYQLAQKRFGQLVNYIAEMNN